MSFVLFGYFRGQDVRFPLISGEVSLGRSPQASLTLPSDWTVVSGLHFSLQIKPDGTFAVRDGVSGKSSTNGTQLNSHYLPADRWTALRQGDELQIGSQLRDSVRLLISPGLDNSHQISSGDQRRWELQGESLSIGRSQECDVNLQGPTISRHHCSINRSGNHILLIDHSRNGVFVNDRPVNGQSRLGDGDQIKVGTNVFEWCSPWLSRETVGSNYRIDVRDLWLKGRINGTNISIEPGQLVAFVGGSGTGKSSLLTTIVGQNLGYEGQILINGNELRESYSSLKQEIGFVPQDDVVHLDLTVEEVLRYSARLKLPDIEQQRAAVERVLGELEMNHRRKALVRELSGGQRKRVSIGVELIADPRILFLDEPTSGLDPGLDKRMMELLRSFADAGRTVALVTHATNNVMLSDQVVFLGRGGYLCYAGPPEKCLDHFKLSGDFSNIYQYLECSDQEIAELADSYRPQIMDILPPISKQPSTQMVTSKTKQAGRVGLAIQQFQTLLTRDIILTWRDRTTLILNAITAPLAVAMIAFAANEPDIFSNLASINAQTYPGALRILFVIVCATIWVGLSTSLQALVKERSIFCRERSFNLLPEAYLVAKIVVMVLQALIQTLLIFASIKLFFTSPDTTFLNWPIAIALVCFATLITIGAQALMASSLVRNSQQASSIAPLLLIPQLVFGGVLFVLSEPSNNIYPLITSRWAIKAMGVFSDITQLIPGGQLAVDRINGANAYETTISNLDGSFMIMALQLIVFIMITFGSLLFLKHNR